MAGEGYVEFLVIIDLEVVCDDTSDAGRQEIVEWPWAVLDIETRSVVDKKLLLVQPEWNVNPNPLPIDGASARDDVLYCLNLQEAVRQFDLYLFTSFISRNIPFCLLCDGPWDIHQLLVAEASKKSIALNDHYRTFFNLRSEFQKCYLTEQPPVDRRSMLQFLGITDEGGSLPSFDLTKYDPGVDDCLALARVVGRMINDGHSFVTPEAVPEAEWTSVCGRSVTPGVTQMPVGGVIRLRGLPWSCTEEDILEFLQTVRVVPGGINFVLNKQKKSTGEAFAQVADGESMEQAILRHRQMMGHRYIEVFRSSPQEMATILGKAEAKRAVGAASGASSQTIANAAPPKTYVAKMRGLPYSVTEEEVLQFFNDLEIAPNGVHFLYGSDGRPVGEAFVEFASEVLLSKALQRNKNRIGSRYIELFRVSSADMAATLERHGGTASKSKPTTAPSGSSRRGRRWG